MGYIDLHVHSTASDGTFSPADTVARAVRMGLDAMALTDHDTTDGLREAQAAAQGAIEVVPGIELSCDYHGTEIHILGLFIHREDPGLIRRLNLLRQKRCSRNEEMLRRLNQAGFPLKWEDLTEGRKDAVITRAHFAKAMLRKGYVTSIDQAFRRYLDHRGPYCPPKENLTPGEALQLLRENGAFSALAHPALYHLGYAQIEELTAELKALGLDGLEVYHSSNYAGQSLRLKTIALKHSLLPTGGSDFHGSNKPDIEIGSGRGGLRISHLLLEDIKNLLEKRG